MDVLREAFSLFDVENVGEITVRELSAVLSAQGYPTSDEALHGMLNEVDEDGSGTIEFNEFCLLMTRKLRPSEQEEEIHAAFKALDKDMDGFINAADLQDYMADLGQEMTLIEVKAMIAAADEDKDEKICFEEFHKLITG